MNTIGQTTAKEDVKVNVRMKLSALWVALMLIYIYADILSLFRPGSSWGHDVRTDGTFPGDPRFVVRSLRSDD